MKKGLTELVFILDRSGSMQGLEQDTIGGYNRVLTQQKAEEGEARVTTVLFDDQYELLHDRIDLKGVSPVTGKDYYVRGTTALLDAMGRTLQKIERVQQQTMDEEKAERVLFVIITDGMENASREFSYTQIKESVERLQKEYGWEFLFLGANIDAVETAGQFGIQEDRAANYHADGEGTDLNFEVINQTVSRFRSSEAIDPDWKKRIDEDFRKRKKD